ncbi:type II secretion system F family protein [Acetobacterium tundrae]|uniref:Type II secretion system F family protein n=1 Tax=Acetobacterium tundrae TaxID=132932 RepID=A0ABR6WLF8_9FIRM|nr:type II secretion system F family protein [Acetobacterium tundrae]
MAVIIKRNTSIETEELVLNAKQRKPLSNNEIYTFCEQMGMILKAGISSIEGISIMLEDATDGEGKDILNEIYRQLDLTSSLYLALSATHVFPKYVLDMTNLGETSGKLDEVMESLALYYQREENLSKGIKSAITYPLIMIGMMILVIVVLLVKVMPIFNQVFIQLGSEMTGFSKGILDFGNMLSRYSAVFVVLLALLLVLVLYLNKSIKGKEQLKQFGSKFFLTKNLYEKIALGRFSNGMAITLKSGLDTDQSIELIAQLADHPILQEKIERCKKYISEGDNFSDALNKSNIFSGIYSRMLAIGYKSGVMDVAMQKIAIQYNEEVDTSIGHLLSILEPTLVAILSTIVGMILLSVMLPLMGIMITIG